MTKGKPVLGRGLASLISRTVPPAPPIQPPGRQDDGVSNEIIVNIDLGNIQKNPYQPRAEFDPASLDELKRSIQEKGIIQPITVRRIENGYQLISGERRVRAARVAGLTQIPAYIIKVRSNEEMLELALIENLQREHLNPIEISISYKRLIDECSLTQEQVADKIGKDRSTVTNFLRLLKLPEIIQTAVRKDQISAGHARALVAIEDKSLQMEIFRKMIAKDLSVREVERLVKAKGTRKSHTVRLMTSATKSSVASVEEKLRKLLGTRVHLKVLQHGKGEIIIEYYSADDLDRLIDIFSGK
jgi:ParB family chromosome partitioning protein